MNEKLAQIRMLVMDVDGTLTDGGLTFYGGEQIKTFNVYDGLGVRLATTFGLGVAWITGNVSKTVSERAMMLGVKHLYQDARFKTEAMSDLIQKHQLSKNEIAYIGDDLNDLPAFEMAGVRVAVANAADEIKEIADIVTKRCGGQGAVREAIEIILKAKGQWDEAVQSFLDELKREETAEKGPEAVA